MSDATKVTTRMGLGGAVVKEAIAQAKPMAWFVIKRQYGVWMDVAPGFDTEAKAVALMTTMKAGGCEFELTVVSRG